MKKVILAALAATVLGGCGGGDGGSGGGTADVGTLYIGKTTQAVVNASNAKAVSRDALGSFQQSVDIAGSSEMFKSATGATEGSFQIQPVINILKNSVLKVRSKPTVAKTAASVKSGTEYAATIGYGGSGSYEYSYTINDTTEAVSGTMTFKDYVYSAGAPAISGSMSISNSYGPGVDDFSADVKMSNISVTASTLSLTMNGSFSVVGTGTKETVTASVVALDNGTKKTHYMKNFKIERTYTSPSTLTISGTFYNNDYGYVDISTTTSLTAQFYYSDLSELSGGELLFTGANGTKAKLAFPGSSVYWHNGTSFVQVP